VCSALFASLGLRAGVQTHRRHGTGQSLLSPDTLLFTNWQHLFTEILHL
jgi:hypothetical protein